MSEHQIQTCFPGMRPKRPTMRTRRVAEAIARRIVEEVNIDDFYWTREELPDRIADVAEEIMRRGPVQSIFYRLWKGQPPFDSSGRPYGWEGIDDHCNAIVHEIAHEELARAVREHERSFGNA